jgi:hypothetical protein
MNSKLNKSNTLKILSLNSLMIVGLLSGLACSKKPVANNSDDQQVSILSSNLKMVEKGFLPESIADDGTQSQSLANKSSDDDICKDLDFVECQPRLIRAYLRYGKSAVTTVNSIVTSISNDLAKTGEVSSGTISSENQVTIIFNKQSHTDFELILLKANQPAGRILASPNLYIIQLDMALVDNKDSETKAGKLEMKVSYENEQSWHSTLTFTELPCNSLKPEDPQTAMIEVSRAGGKWVGQSALYNSTSGDFHIAKSCSNTATPENGLIVLTEFVADAHVAKASIYFFKGSDNRTEYSQFGINNYCENYPDRCQSLADSFGSTPQLVDQHLNQFTNPYCVRRGSAVVTWNSSCENESSIVSESVFVKSSQWTSPLGFSQLKIVIPAQLQ